MSSDWLDLGPIDDFPDGGAVLKKAGSHRLACVRMAGEVHAVDDRCPHQGYPLAQGSVNGCVLTCAWHNWKFDLKTGDCLFGGEGVRRYPTRVEGGRVRVRLDVDPAVEIARLEASLRAAVVEADVSRVVRDGLRLSLEIGRLPPADGAPRSGPLSAVRPAGALLARDAAERAPWGFDHGMALHADLCSWIERGWIDATEGLAVTAMTMGEPNMARGPRARVEPASAGARVDVDLALAAEKRADAEAGVRRFVRDGDLAGARDALSTFVGRHLYDYGHGAIFVTKALELVARFPESAEEIMASLCVMLGWATADTSLPPFAATRGALESLASADLSDRRAGFDRAALEASILEGERPAVTSMVARLAEGCAHRELLFAVAHAAAERLLRFDASWETRLDAEVGVLDVTHATTFAEAALRLSESASPALTARLCVLGAGFVGKLRRADGPAPARRAPTLDLVEAVRTRDASSAIAAAATLDTDARRALYKKLAPFFAFEVAVRPIRVAHAVKVAEAMFRLDHADPHADGTYMAALLACNVPRRPERQPRRVAAVAMKFLADGRPPEGLY